MANVGYATLTVIPSLRGVGPALTAGVAAPATAAGTVAGKNLGSSMVAGVKSFAGPLVAVAAGTAVFGWLKQAQQSASDLNETASMSAVIFGDQAGAIDKWASSAATSAGLSKGAALEAAAGFGDMFLQLGFAGDEAASLSTSTVQLAADLGSFKNLPTADVTERISAAFRGEYDSLQTLIPNINAARVEKEALAATGKTVASSLTAQEKAAAVLAIVNKDGARAQGDFARTSTSNANAQKILAARYENIKTTVGKGLIPVMAGLITVANTALGVFITIGTFFGDHAKTIGMIAGVITAVFIPALISMGVTAAASAAETVALWLMIKAEAIQGALAQSWASAKVVAGWVLMGAQSLLAAAKVALAWLIAMGPIGLVIAAVVGLTALIIANWDTIKQAIGAAWDWVKEKTALIWDGIVWFFEHFTLIGLIISNFDKIRSIISAAWEWVSGKTTAVWNAVTDFLSGVWEGIKATAKAAIDSILGWISDVLRRIKEIKDALLGAGGGVLGGGGVVGGLDLPEGTGERGTGSQSFGDQRSFGQSGMTVIQHFGAAEPPSVGISRASTMLAILGQL